ncbi:hypothetical protein [Paenibacillus sp. CMAA1364]
MNLVQQPSTTKNQHKHTEPRARRLFSRKYKFVAGLLAAILPGLGHIYLGLIRKGVSFIFILMLDISALSYFSSVGMRINVPFLILLTLFIPIFYFYNVYNVLQLADFTVTRYGKATKMSDKDHVRRNPFRGEEGISFGVLLVIGGTVLILFHQRPIWLKEYIELYGEITMAPVLVILGIGLWVREMLMHRTK